MHILWEVIDMKQLVVFLLILLMSSDIIAQDSIDGHPQGFRPMVGFSLPELLHIGTRYQVNDMQYGLSIGSFPADNESIITYSADIMWHLFGEKNALNMKPWYGKIGYTFMREETDFEINTWSYAHVRFGHAFALSNFIALHIDAGLMFQTMHQEIEKKPKNSWLNFDFEFPVLPSVGITTAYSL